MRRSRYSSRCLKSRHFPVCFSCSVERIVKVVDWTKRVSRWHEGNLPNALGGMTIGKRLNAHTKWV